MMTGKQKRQEYIPVIPAEYVWRPHMATFLNAQNSRSTFQANQEDQLVHLKKSA